MRHVAVVAAMTAALLAGLNPATAAEKLAVVSDFALKDYRGREYKLSEFEKQPIVVVAFLGIECPLAKQYSVRLQELSKEYASKGVTFLGVDANSQDAPTEIASFVRRQGLEFPFLIDIGSKLAERLGATRTPEVVVLDQNRAVRYRGRIDDQFQIGVIRDKADRQELRNAVDALLAGNPVSVSETQPIGCLIGRPQSPTEKPTVTWSKEIVRIFQNRCQECHRDGDIGPFALFDYEEAAGWADMIGEVLRENRMPPWHANPEYGHFSNARMLPAEEKQAILTWVKEGCPKGDPADLPAQRTFTKGWQLKREPDAAKKSSTRSSRKISGWPRRKSSRALRPSCITSSSTCTPTERIGDRKCFSRRMSPACACVRLPRGSRNASRPVPCSASRSTTRRTARPAMTSAKSVSYTPTRPA